MRFLLDESTDIRLGHYLAGLGHDVKSISEDFVPGSTDHEVLAIARNERRVLITADRDFGELVYRYRHRHAGVIYLRLSTTRLAVKIARMDHVLSEYWWHLDEFFLVVTDHAVRIGLAAGRSAA